MRKLRRGFSSFSVLSSQGDALSTMAAKSARGIDRLAITFGSQGAGQLSASWVARKISGAANRVEKPGGVGRTFGAAKISMSAPKARWLITSNRSATETRSRV